MSNQNTKMEVYPIFLLSFYSKTEKFVRIEFTTWLKYINFSNSK